MDRITARRFEANFGLRYQVSEGNEEEERSMVIAAIAMFCCD